VGHIGSRRPQWSGYEPKSARGRRRRHLSCRRTGGNPQPDRGVRRPLADRGTPGRIADYDTLHGGKDYWHTFVAETARGRIAVYCCFYQPFREESPTLAVFDDLDTARKALANDERIDHDVLDHAETALSRHGKRGEEIRWRDI
jgi:hypothetical protein